MYCQKCRTPLKLDSSLEDLNPAAYDLLVASSSQQEQHPKKLASGAPPSAPSSRPIQPHEQARRAVYDTASKNAPPATFKRHAGALRGGGRDASAMSFIYLTESQVAPPSLTLPNRTQQVVPSSSPRKQSPHKSSNGNGGEADHEADDGGTKAHEMERIEKLFEILSARSDIDHPVCIECTELLVEEQQKKLEQAARERDAYVSYLKQLQGDAPPDEELKAEEAALRKARQEEADAKAELLRLEREKAELDAEILALEDESRQLDTEEEAFWRSRNAFAGRLSEFQNERDSVNSRFDHDARMLEKLQRSNVYNDTFCISHDGTFATINGLRLGRLSHKPVDWPEINAAWGHALLLLVTVADKLGYRFEGYEPLPMGSTSKIIRFDPVSSSPSNSRHSSIRNNAPPPPPKKQELELYSSGLDLPLSFLMHRKFDQAMVAFLELVRQLGAHVQATTRVGGALANGSDGAAVSSALSLPYRIEGDRIHDVSIRLGGGIAQDDGGWTKACKLTLTCCKFLLAHASNVNSSANGRAAAANNGAATSGAGGA